MILQENERTIAAILEKLLTTIRAAVVIEEETLRLLVVAALARGHVLLEDVPGVGKTLLARAVAAAMGGTFHRLQFTPDLLPADITGGSVYDPQTGEFSFRAGPVFANVVLADELNRGTPRAQSALLEAMGEGQVSADGETHRLPQPFFVVATQNPIEQHGTFPLPESELDRFMMLLHIGSPDLRGMQEVLRRHEHAEPLVPPIPVLDLATLSALQDEVFQVAVAEAARNYIAAITKASRDHPAVGLPISVRAAVALLRSAQAMALFSERNYVLPDDIKAVASAVLAHRLATRGVPGSEVVEEILRSVALPGVS